MLLLLGLVGSCSGSSTVGRVELEVSEQRWDCGEDACDGPRDVMSTWAFVSEETTQFEEGGLFLFFEIHRDDGTTAYVEVDVPVTRGEGEPRARYTEYSGSEVTFLSSRAYGRVQLPWVSSGEVCGCSGGRLELVFLDAGPDGALETDDDAVRRVGRARYTESWFCMDAVRLEPTSDVIEVERFDPCAGEVPGPVPTTGPSYEPAPYEPGEDGCGGSAGDSTYDDSAGCETTVDGGGSSSAGGCEGSSSSSSSSGSGCEGGSSGGSGCEGDTSSSGSGCSGDTSASGSGCSGSGGSAGSGCSGDASPGVGPVPPGFEGDAGVLMSVMPTGRDACGPPGRGRSPLAGPRQTLALMVLALFWVARRRFRLRPA